MNALMTHIVAGIKNDRLTDKDRTGYKIEANGKRNGFRAYLKPPKEAR